MGCAFELKHPFRGTSGCQFGVPDEGLVPFAGKEWCRFHLPVEADGEKSPKAEWEPDEIGTFNNAVLKILKEARNEGKTADLTGVVFPGDISFAPIGETSEAKPPLPQVLCFDAAFHGAARFEGATFGGHAGFGGATFGGGASFDRATFGGTARFNEAKFGGDASFDGASFGGDASFVAARFGGGASFDSATFGGDASFGEARFEGNARFNRARFGGDARFNRARFEGNARFNRARFEGTAWFEGARFRGHAEFSGVKFEGTAWLDVPFKCAAEFSGVTFESSVLFNGTTFGNTESYSFGCQFMNARFGGFAGFMETVFNASADFSCVSPTGKDEDGPTAVSFHGISFQRAEFHKFVRFTNRRFLDTTSFKGTLFKIAPEFHNCDLHEDTDFSDPKFRDTKSDHAARAYRTLRHAMAGVRAHEEEAQFYALEQKSRRNREDTPLWAKLLSFLYELTSDFGRSAWRPLGCLAGLLILFGGFYFWSPPDCHLIFAPGIHPVGQNPRDRPVHPGTGPRSLRMVPPECERIVPAASRYRPSRQPPLGT